MKDQIPEFLQEKLDLKGYSQTGKFPQKIKDFMISYSNFYKWDLENNLIKIFKVMKQGTTDLPICNYKDCNNTVKFDYYLKVTKGCCADHNKMLTMLDKYGVENPSQNKKIVEKRSKTNLIKYGSKAPAGNKTVMDKMKATSNKRFGVNCPLQSKEVRKKIEDTNLGRYGYKYALQNEDVVKKVRQTMMNKYGVEHPLQSKEISDKVKNKVLERYGTEYYSQSDTYKEKVSQQMFDRKQTFLKNYGEEHHMKSESGRQKHRDTCLLKYGTEHHMMIPEIHTKQQKSCYKLKEYKWKTGEISSVQGYEPIVLKELEDKGYLFNDVLTDPQDMPKIIYRLDEKEHRYFPDIYIPKENIIIEVKSDWTLNLDIDKNQAKFKAVKDAGYDFKLEVR